MGGSYLSTSWVEKITGQQIDTVGTQNTTISVNFPTNYLMF